MWTPKYENGCLIMLKYALEPLYAPEPLCDCLHQVVTRDCVDAFVYQFTSEKKAFSWQSEFQI